MASAVFEAMLDRLCAMRWQFVPDNGVDALVTGMTGCYDTASGPRRGRVAAANDSDQAVEGNGADRVASLNIALVMREDDHTVRF